MRRSELLKALLDAINILERLQKFSLASDDMTGVGKLHRITLCLQFQHNNLRFVDKWTYWSDAPRTRLF